MGSTSDGISTYRYRILSIEGYDALITRRLFYIIKLNRSLLMQTDSASTDACFLADILKVVTDN